MRCLKVAWHLSSVKSGASGCLHIAGVDLIISSDVRFCRVTGTPCPTSEQIYSDRLWGKDLYSDSMIQLLSVNTFISKLALSLQNFDLVKYPFFLLSFLTYWYIGQTPDFCVFERLKASKAPRFSWEPPLLVSHYWPFAFLAPVFPGRLLC